MPSERILLFPPKDPQSFGQNMTLESEDDDERGARLDDGGMEDYKAIAALDRYDTALLDDRTRLRQLSARERREAELLMAERDARERESKALIARAHGGGTGVARTPKALERLHASSAGVAEISRVGKLLKIPEAIVDKAAQMLRKAFVGGTSLPASYQQCLPAVCLEIASKVCQRAISREALFRCSKLSSDKHYLGTFKAMHCLLRIRREVSMARLCAESNATLNPTPNSSP